MTEDWIRRMVSLAPSWTSKLERRGKYKTETVEAVDLERGIRSLIFLSEERPWRRMSFFCCCCCFPLLLLDSWFLILDSSLCLWFIRLFILVCAFWFCFWSVLNCCQRSTLNQRQDNALRYLDKAAPDIISAFMAEVTSALLLLLSHLRICRQPST